jgi:hypothetical protein
MKCPLALLVVSLISCGALSKPLLAQFANITGAPFTATFSYEGQINNQTTNAIEEIARATDGSTYDATKAKDGHLVHISIVDIPNNRRIELMPLPPSYTYRIQAVDRKLYTCTIEDYRATLQQAQESFRDRPDRDKPNGSHHHEIPLGVRQEDGMILFGNRDEIILASGEKRTVEAWQSDLGVAATVADTGTTTKTVRTLTSLHRVEPDPKLFEIPAQYLSHPDPLLDGKKVFVDNETGVPEVGDAAARAFNGSPPQHSWVTVGSIEDADLVAEFVSVTRSGDLDPPFEMKIHVPRSDDTLFVSHLRRNPDYQLKSYLNYEKSLATSCVNDLWNRVANTHIGLIPNPVRVPKPTDLPSH